VNRTQTVQLLRIESVRVRMARPTTDTRKEQP
jgi:hypothetical protein